MDYSSKMDDDERRTENNREDTKSGARLTFASPFPVIIFPYLLSGHSASLLVALRHSCVNFLERSEIKHDRWE